MATNFKKIRAKMPAERRERIEKRNQELLGEFPLQELRRARELSQEISASFPEGRVRIRLLEVLQEKAGPAEV